MEVKLDLYLSFPIPPHKEPEYEKLLKYFGSVEDVEQAFEIEFSCGDGKYFNDLIANWPDTDEGNEEVAKYDGQVCTDTPPRLKSIKMSMKSEQMTVNKSYRFTVKYFEKVGEETYYINGKERSRNRVA